MFVINPDPYSLPCYRIGPFQTKDLSINHKLPDSDLVDSYLLERFGSRDFFYTENGREAINIALSYYDLEKDDVVSILTTSGNFYISGCVTKEIEKFCKWSRSIVPKTKVIIVNHEFGYIYPEMDFLVSLGIPIIEDCCTTFFSQDHEMKVGSYGDFSVYSFPKFFPIQIGGILVNNNGISLEQFSAIESPVKDYIRRVVSHHLNSLDELFDRRNTIYNNGNQLYESLGFTERFEKDSLSVPSVMLLKNNSIIKDLPVLKRMLWDNGIQTSLFYGEDAFFLPSHQNLNENDLLYFVEVLKYAIRIST